MKNKLNKLSNSILSKFTGENKRRNQVISFVAAFALIGAITFIVSHASGFSIAIEPELASTISGCAKKVTGDSTASGNAYLQICSIETSAGNNSPGAHLPIDYSLSSLPGTVRYVATNGSDSNTGSVSSPYATLLKAINSSAAGDSIVIRGGEYNQGGNNNGGNLAKVTKTLTIMAYPKETPVFTGSRAVSGGWTPEGSLSYITYTPMPADTSADYGTPLKATGKLPDQAWIGNTRLSQVATKAEVSNGKFFVDTGNGGRMYLTSSDAAKSSIEVSKYDQLFYIGAPNTKLEGIRIRRYSDPAARYGVVTINASADGTKLTNVEILDSAEMASKVTGDGGAKNINQNVTFKNVTIDKSGWMGVNANYTDNFTMDAVKITNLNLDNEYNGSPQTGALKTSRSRYIKVLNSEFDNMNGAGLWFDQSNVDVDMANNTIKNVSGASVFFEISDDLLMVNNYIESSGANAVEIVSSSGAKLVNNTLVGGKDPLGIYVDPRAVAGCSTPNGGCTYIYANSDWDTVRPIPSTLDWMTKIDLLVNNVVVQKAANDSRYCGPAPICYMQTNKTGHVGLKDAIHKADPSRGIPQTFMDDNIYANVGQYAVRTQESGSYTNVAAWSSFLAGSPVGISGLEVGSKSGSGWASTTDGTPTAALAAIHNQATQIPNSLNGNFSTATINNIMEYVNNGAQHYGVFNK